MKKASAPDTKEIHPVDALYAVCSRVSFLIDAFGQPGAASFEFGENAQFGFTLYLRDIHAELKRIETQLSQQEEVRS